MIGVFLVEWEDSLMSDEPDVLTGWLFCLLEFPQVYILLQRDFQFLLAWATIRAASKPCIPGTYLCSSWFDFSHSRASPWSLESRFHTPWFDSRPLVDRRDRRKRVEILCFAQYSSYLSLLSLRAHSSFHKPHSHVWLVSCTPHKQPVTKVRSESLLRLTFLLRFCLMMVVMVGKGLLERFKQIPLPWDF